MSLNGLDATQVNDAYQSAVNEAGGWLLLNYTNRAEVGLLKNGSGGIQEVREAVAQYDEQSPLFGLIHYRRRKVLLKYVPEGTSRLWQARLPVHFQSVSERFSPTDTVFSFSTPAELADNALSAACALHTSPASIKSASSLRRKGLAEIAEDASENQAVVQRGEYQDVASVTPPSATPSQTRLEAQDDTLSLVPPTERAPSSSQSSITIRNSDKALPPIPTSPQEEHQTRDSVDSEEQVRSSFEGRASSQSARPSTREGHDRYDVNGFKIKEKVGPRPSTDSTSGISAADPASRSYNPRPTSSLPPSVRMPLRKSMPVRRSPHPGQNPPLQIPSVSPPHQVATSSLPTLPLSQPPPPPNPISTRPRMASSKSSNMTPEKRRLMKAVELRQKQLAAQKAAEGPALKGIPAESEEHRKEKLPLEDALIRSSEAPSTDESIVTIQAAEKEKEMGLVRPRSIDFGKDDIATVEASPISMPEVSDGPSTQASSVSEEDATQQYKEIEKGPNPVTTILPNHDASAAASAKEQAPGSIEDGFTSNVQHAPIPTVGFGIGPKDISEQIKNNVAPTELQIAQSTISLAEGDSSLQSGGNTRESVESMPADVSQDADAKGPLEVESAPKEGPQAIDSTTIPTPQDTIADQSPKAGQKLYVLPCTIAESISPQEVPLPPISEDEGIFLSLQQDSLRAETPLQGIFHEVPSPPLHEVTSHSHIDDDKTVNTKSSTGLRLSTTDIVADRRSSRQNRRHGVVEPIGRISSGENSDDQYLSDDSLMEELKSATVQEAKPVRVSRSPITPDFPRATSEQRPELVRNPRSVSSPLEMSMKDDRKTPSPQLATLIPPRSVSVSHPRPASPSEVSPPTLKKVGVSSGISQRIKALETLSSRPTSPSSVLHSPANPPPAYASLGSRKSSFPSRPRTSDRPASRQSLSPAASGFDLASPKITTPKPYNQFVSVSVASKPGKSRPESISVTAKIVRGERNRATDISLDVSEPHVMDLHNSPLTVEHRNAEFSAPQSSKKPQIKRHTTAPSNPSTSPDHKRESFFSSRRDSIHSVSNGSRRGSDTGLSQSASEVSLNGMVSDGAKEEKKGSKKSRMLKRMSNITSASRRSIATALSPGPAREREREQPIVEQPEPVQAAAPIAAVDMGDVNVQFPDTLLWKRRHMAINEGTLVLSPSKVESSSRVATKRYPLPDFHPPYIPDQDRQEMPHSVTLDFKDGGSTLQCACENLVGQAGLLRALTVAHRQFMNS